MSAQDESPPTDSSPTDPKPAVLAPLAGRCGSCARFVRVIEVRTSAGQLRRAGECLLAIWPAPLYENNTCGKYVQKGTFHLQQPKKKGAARAATSEARSAKAGHRPSDDGEESVTLTPPFEWPPQAWPEDLLTMDADEFRSILRGVIREELGASEVELAGKWQGGELVLIPGKEGVQERRISIDSLFRKVIGIRDKLRVLEQKINGSPKLGDDEKIQLQQYITGAYGSLTTFNILFAEREDGFVGQKGDE